MIDGLARAWGLVVVAVLALGGAAWIAAVLGGPPLAIWIQRKRGKLPSWVD